MAGVEQRFSFPRLYRPLTTVKAISIIGILGFIVFGNALFNGFIMDDSAFIINNPDVHSINIAHLFSGNKFNSFGYYRPISAFYFALLYSLFGTQAFFYHFVQVCLHILNTILLYLILRKLFSLYNTNDAIVPKLEEKEWHKLSKKQKRKYQSMYFGAAKASLILSFVGYLGAFLPVSSGVCRA